MKNLKKLKLGLALVVALFGLALLLPKHSLAAGGPFDDASDWANASYTQISNTQIRATFPNHDPVLFTGSDGKTFNAAVNGTGVCAGYIALQDDVFPKDANVSVSVQVKGAVVNCVDYRSGDASVENGLNGNGPSKITYGSKDYVPLFSQPTKYYGNTKDVNTCYGGSVLVLDSPGGNTGTLYQLQKGALGPFWNLQEIYQGFPSAAANCGVQGGAQPISVKNVNGQFVASDNNNGSQAQEKLTSCESNFNKPFTWLVCPMLNVADDVSGAFNSFIEKQLCFKTGPQSDTGGVVCEGKNNLTNQVKTDWSIFTRLATALLVIVMLVAVISQALGFESGPFNAYTIRKLLPRLVAAVILMQISWFLFKWTIDLSNDAGYAIKDLLFAPFGGVDNIDLGKLVGHGVTVTTGGKEGANAFALFYGIAAVVGFYYLIPALPLLALYVVLALLVAFLVLVLRKMLLIVLVILAPLALIAWLLPGTDKYWKLWRDNFIRLVFMFPLVMALLASGRIFAYITGSGNIASGGVTGFADLAIIIAAWFAPYFLLPKTFSWGGSMFASAANAINKGAVKVSQRPKEYAKELEKGYRTERKLKSQERVAAHEGFNMRAPWRLPIDTVRSGKMNPLLGMPGSRRRQRSVDSYVSQGLASEAEDLKAATDRIRRDWEGMQEGDVYDKEGNIVATGVTKDDFLQDGYWERHTPGKRYFTHDGRELDPTKYKGTANKQAILDQWATLGGATGFRHLEQAFDAAERGTTDEYGNQSPLSYAEFRKFMTRNVGTVLPKFTNIYKGVASTADGGPESFEQQHGTQVESMDAKLVNRVLKGENPANNLASLDNYSSAFVQAAQSPRKGSIEQGATRMMKALFTKDDRLRRKILASINFDPEDGREVLGIEALDVFAKREGSDGKMKVVVDKAGLPVLDAEKVARLEKEVLEPLERRNPTLRASVERLVRDTPEGGLRTDDELRAYDSGGGGRTRSRDAGDSRPPDDPVVRYYAPSHEAAVSRAVDPEPHYDVPSGPAPTPARSAPARVSASTIERSQERTAPAPAATSSEPTVRPQAAPTAFATRADRLDLGAAGVSSGEAAAAGQVRTDAVAATGGASSQELRRLGEAIAENTYSNQKLAKELSRQRGERPTTVQPTGQEGVLRVVHEAQPGDVFIPGPGTDRARDLPTETRTRPPVEESGPRRNPPLP